MNRLLAVAALMAVSHGLIAQTSAYQSADGNTSIYLYNAKANIIYNVTSTQFDLGYLHEGAGKGWIYGGDFTGKPSSNLSPQILQAGSSPPSVGGSLSIGRHALFSNIDTMTPTSHLRDDWDSLHFTYTGSSFSTVASASAEPQSQHFAGFRGLASTNSLVRAPGASLILGFAAGVERTNNVTQLKQITVLTSVTQSAPGIAPFEIAKETSAYLGNYKTSIGAPIYADAVYIPTALPWLDIDPFIRADAAHANRYIEGGIGIYFAQANKPTQVLGGASLAWKNGAPTLSIVAGFSF